MPVSERQLVNYLGNFKVSELKQLTKYFNIRVTRQSGGGPCNKRELIWKLVGGGPTKEDVGPVPEGSECSNLYTKIFPAAWEKCPTAPNEPKCFAYRKFINCHSPVLGRVQRLPGERHPDLYTIGGLTPMEIFYEKQKARYLSERITAIYTAHARDELPHLPQLLEQERERLPQLLKATENKYGVPHMSYEAAHDLKATNCFVWNNNRWDFDIDPNINVKAECPNDYIKEKKLTTSKWMPRDEAYAKRKTNIAGIRSRMAELGERAGEHYAQEHRRIMAARDERKLAIEHAELAIQAQSHIDTHRQLSTGREMLNPMLPH